MDLRLPNCRKLWDKEKKVNRGLRAELADLRAELAQARIDLGVASSRGDELESANEGLRADLASWMGERTLLSDERGEGPTTGQLRR